MNSVSQPADASGARAFFKRISVFPPLRGLPFMATAFIVLVTGRILNAKTQRSKDAKRDES